MHICMCIDMLVYACVVCMCVVMYMYICVYKCVHECVYGMLCVLRSEDHVHVVLSGLGGAEKLVNWPMSPKNVLVSAPPQLVLGIQAWPPGFSLFNIGFADQSGPSCLHDKPFTH